MIKFTISVTDIEDAITMEEWELVNEHITFAKEVVKEGGYVVFQQEYENAPPDILKILKTEEDIKNWKKNVEDVIHNLKQQAR